MAKSSQFCPVPQVAVIAKIGPDGIIRLTKAIKRALEIEAHDAVFLTSEDELQLTVQPDRGTRLPILERSRVRLPSEDVGRLGLSQGGKFALLQRSHGLAVKRCATDEVPSEWARIVDIETADLLLRRCETAPMPERLVPRLKSRHEGLTLRHSVRKFLHSRRSLEAWLARRLIGAAEPADDDLRDQLVSQLIREQSSDGSWDDSVPATARALRELAALGLPADEPALRRAAQWLLDRPESQHNPGMFFATDELVVEQERIVAARTQQVAAGTGGPKPRFREIRSAEKRFVMRGDAQIVAPCGPRLMWPNALTIEALLAAGYERHPRIQRALRTMMTHDWCECAYQHGTSSWRNREPLTSEQIALFEQACIRQYRYGGLERVC